MSLGSAATRSRLVRLRRRLERVRRGSDVLRRKREALVVELFRQARPAVEARARVEVEARAAYELLHSGLVLHDAGGLDALGWPSRELGIELAVGRTWGVRAVRLEARPGWVRSPAERGNPPATAGPTVALGAERFERLVELLIDTLPLELHLRELADALGRTTRQLHTLEQRVATRVARELIETRRVLDERERDEHLRLRRQLRRAGGAGPAAGA